MKKVIFLILFFCLFSPLFSNEAKGPLLGKNYYVPFLPFYSFPGVPAKPKEKFDLSFSIAQYYVQDIVTEFHLIGNNLIQERYIDYEGYIFEPSISFNPIKTLEFGLTSRIHSYYGGVLDSLFEGFHNLFSFPNGGREYYPLNDIYINLHTNSGIDLSLTKPLTAIGDTDLFLKWSFFSMNFMDLALFSAIKFPTGSMENISGSGYLDLGFSLLADFYITDWLAIYIQNGLTIPGQMMAGNDVSPEPIYTLLTSAEFIISPLVSLLVQFRMNTSPIKEGATIPENISYTVKLHQPMTNLLGGVVLNLSGYRMQFSFEEDPFTNNGADLILNLTVSKSFNLLK